MTDTDVMGEH